MTVATASAPAAAARLLRRRYVDSVVLMRLALRLTHEPGVIDAAALMATDANKTLLRDGGFAADLADAAADDLVVAVKADDSASAEAALASVEDLLTEAATLPADARHAATLDDALALQPTTNLAVISVPGEYAAAEARRAIEHGLHVFVFSSNVALDDEIALKQLAAERGVLCMGPDCGTALIAGRGIGFANAVRRGPVGIVGAAGTGIQMISSLLERWEIGVSHAIGAGGRDGSDAVGGSTLVAGLRALDADPTTKAIVLLGKPPGPETAARLRDAASAASTPVVVCFLGEPGPDEPTTLDEAARHAALLVGANPTFDADPTPSVRLAEGQHWVRGLYAGGTLGYEAQLILAAAGLTVRSNIPLPGGHRLEDSNVSVEHTVIDLGSEEFTRGRPHPMIDARVRCARLLTEAADPAVCVILFDIVLGYGAAADPAGDLVEAIAAAHDIAGQRGQHVQFVASVCGTDADPQMRHGQEATLRDAGVHVTGTNAAAARLAARIAMGAPA